MMEAQPLKLLFFVSEDWYFCSHRLPIAEAAIRQGYHVVVVTRVKNHGERITRAGCKLVPVRLSRRGKNPFSELRLLFDLVRIYRRECPDIVHQVALKPVIYGSIAARISRVPAVVNALAGMGHLFISKHWRVRLFRPFVEFAYRQLLNHANYRVILQNPDDQDFLVKRGIVEQHCITLIRGSGVDTHTYVPTLMPAGAPLVMLVSRMLWDKGVGEFVEAARRLRQAGVLARFALVGDADAENPAAIPDVVLRDWENEGVIERWGRRDDMIRVFGEAHIVCLPSYREGLPKVLIEAAASGRPIVASDAPGCREIVRDGENGFLVPVRDAIALAAALQKLIGDPDLCSRMGRRGREIVEAEFALDKVVQQTLALYKELLDR